MAEIRNLHRARLQRLPSGVGVRPDKYAEKRSLNPADDVQHFSAFAGSSTSAMASGGLLPEQAEEINSRVAFLEDEAEGNLASRVSNLYLRNCHAPEVFLLGKYINYLI